MKRLLSAILILAALFPAPQAGARKARQAAAKKPVVSVPNLSFSLSSDGSAGVFAIEGKEEEALQGADFWRLILDDGLKTEIPVLSSQQKGNVTVAADGSIRVVYESLLSEWGENYDVRFVLDIAAENGLIKFTPTVENNTRGVRINEVQCPMAGFSFLCGPKAEDALYLPTGLGRRVENPWAWMEASTAKYYLHDEKENTFNLPYPRSTMSWYGIQSGDKFLYLVRPDRDMRYCFLSIRQKIHAQPSELTLGFNHFPMARPGEKITLPPSCVGLLDGDWRTAADRYRSYAEKTFYKVPAKADWVKNMTGWQRIMFRTQFGEDLLKPSDLPEVFRIGRRYGLNTIFIFAWWLEGMDRAYPKYEEPWPGAFKELKENIQKVQEMGGHVILECNCHFLDQNSEFYKAFGDQVKIIDINGSDVRAQYSYAGRGEFRLVNGKNQFPLICSCTPLWRNQVLSQLRFMGDELDAQCVFADCYGGCPFQPCFNPAHEHGNRIDEEWAGKRAFWEAAEAYADESGRVLATEVVSEGAACYNQFIHGNVNASFAIKSDEFPQLFRYVYPEVITSNRGVRCSEGQYDRQLKYAMMTGMRMDAEVYVCRATIDKDPAYAECVKFCTDKLVEYGEYFFDGRFTVIDSRERPYYVKLSEYYNADRSKVLRILYNASYRTNATFDGVLLRPDEMRFDIFDAADYRKDRK